MKVPSHALLCVAASNHAMNEPTVAKDTGRIEAFSDGVFAIALTLLAFELKAPLLHSVNNASLIAALIERWPEYLAFANSFASILLMWISHHNIFKAVQKINTRFMIANGLALFFVAAMPYPTSVLAKYILTDAASASAAFYAAYSVLVNCAYILLWRVVLNERELLKSSTTDVEIKKITRGLITPLPIYAAASALAFVNAWITVAITTLLWIYWAVTHRD